MGATGKGPATMCKPGFRKVMEHNQFITLWGFLHLVDQTYEATDKSGKIYKVRPMLDRMLPLFHRYYSPCQKISLDEGMILTKNLFAIKQLIRYKLVRWGIKSFLLCDAKTGYILDAEIYTGRVKDHHWPLVRSACSVVLYLVENLRVVNKNQMQFMDHFYNSIMLFHLLKNKLGVLAMGTIMPSRKHYPKEFSAPRFSNFASCCSYMGAMDRNDQIAPLNKIRGHYLWPHRLFMKLLVWTT